jgi:type IV fimbrial biogenesis protein FimT
VLAVAQGGDVLNTPRCPAAWRAVRGFTLVELMVTIALLALLLGLAGPAFTLWTRNAQVRAVGDALQNGARLAQSEAVRRNRQTVFFLTNSTGCDNTITPAANGRFWSVRSISLLAGESAETVECGNLADRAGGVTIAGPTLICFNSAGRQTANASPGVGGGNACTLDASGVSTYDLSATGADRRLRVLVSLGGQVRMCDRDKTLSATNPDGCPP